MFSSGSQAGSWLHAHVTDQGKEPQLPQGKEPHLPQGMMTSACLRLGATKVSNAGFTNVVYCSITPAMSRPRIATSRCILCDSQTQVHHMGSNEELQSLYSHVFTYGAADQSRKNALCPRLLRGGHGVEHEIACKVS